MMKSMSDYEIVDHLLLDFIDPGDMINYAGQDYLVKDISYHPENEWTLLVVDRMEEELELSLTDGTIVGLCLVD